MGINLFELNIIFFHDITFKLEQERLILIFFTKMYHSYTLSQISFSSLTFKPWDGFMMVKIHRVHFSKFNFNLHPVSLPWYPQSVGIPQGEHKLILLLKFLKLLIRKAIVAFHSSFHGVIFIHAVDGGKSIKNIQFYSSRLFFFSFSISK